MVVSEYRTSHKAVEPDVQRLLEANRLKGLAARRQVLADTLKCCIVSELVPSDCSEQDLVDFGYDMDGARGAICVISKKQKTDDFMRGTYVMVRTRKQELESVSADGLWTPSSDELSLNLNSYIDGYNGEDYFTEMSSSTHGLPPSLYVPTKPKLDTSSISKITKILPWFDEFEETVIMNEEFKSMNKVARLVRSSYKRLKQHYLQMAQLYVHIYSNHWIPIVVTDRVSVLSKNFPKGVLGLRALGNPSDPRLVRALVFKSEDEMLRHRRHAQIMINGGSRPSEAFSAPTTGTLSGVSNSIVFDEKASSGEYSVLGDNNPAGEPSRHSKYATLPDMKQTWSTLPRVHYRDNNKLFVKSMKEMESESTQYFASWSLLEARTFLERLAVCGKNFRRIAVSLPEKTEKDCVDFYYRFKVILKMKPIILATTNPVTFSNNNTTPLASPTSGSNNVMQKSLIDEVLDRVVSVLDQEILVLNSQSLEALNHHLRTNNSFLASTVNNVSKNYNIYDEHPETERKNAIIELIATAVANRGHPAPPQLGIPPVVDSPAIVDPGLKNTFFESITAANVTVAKRSSFSVVKTEIAVLTSMLKARPEPVASVELMAKEETLSIAANEQAVSRTLQAHHTV